MIAASEPLEFVPHGRTVLAKHPEQIYGRTPSTASENSLLYKLTNFAIKDESLLEPKTDQEWWCVREVYYKTKDDFEEDPPTPKDVKEDMSESFQPTSRLKQDFNISIKSELMAGVKRMDTESSGPSAGPSRASSANSSSDMSKRFKLDSSQPPKKKYLNPRTDCCYEEELYVKGCTAVWSKGLISTPATKLSSAEHRETIACYTIENPIKHAAFANFHVAINNTMLLDALNSQIGDVKKNIKIEDSTAHLTTKVMPSILLIDNKCLRVYATDGREYMTSIPFQVKKVWPMKYGVLLEKDATQLMQNSMLPTSFSKLNESYNSTFSKSKTFGNMSAKLRAESVSGYGADVPLPTCFSLSHPLDEVSPILMKSPSHGLQYYSDCDLQIIFVNTNPSIILTYDCKLATHSLWKIRRASRDECLSMCPDMNSTTTVFSQSVDFGSPLHSNLGRNTTNPLSGSPFHSKKAGTPSRSRIDSPLANAFYQQGLSPHHSIGQASSTSMMANNHVQSPPTLPLYPDICLDHIWTDTQSIRRDPIENSTDTKTFLHTDLVGHEYLCFMVKVASVSKLQIVRLQRSHLHGQVGKTNLIVGSVSSVAAKDAVVLDQLNMISLIDESGNIILQSGNHVVGKVHVGGVLARLIDSPYSKRSALQSPFPRRSSLLPARCHDAAPFDDSALHLLSPVPHAAAARPQPRESLGLRGISDACGARATLVFDTGAMYRVSLPMLSCSRLVQYCIAALKALLPHDITMQVIIKWYGVRNAPGSQDLAPRQEWSMFSNLLLSLLGYGVETLSRGHSDEQDCEVATKKQRTSSDGTADDWEYLLNSKLHKAVGNSMAAMLNLPITSADSKRRTDKYARTGRRSSKEEKHQFNTNSLLFPYTVQVLYAFHLIYEEIKLNTLLFSDLKPLSAFLYQIAKDLRLDGYVNHYWLDFPTDFSLEYSTDDSQMSDAVVAKLSQPTYFTAQPPNVFGYLDAMFKDVDVGYYPYLTDVNTMSKDLIEILNIVGNGRNCGVHTISRRDNMAASTPRARRANTHHQAVLTMEARGITPRDIDNLPPALGLALLSICAKCKGSPPAGWPCAAYALVMREDLPPLSAAPNHEYLESQALEVLEKETAYSLSRNPMEEPSQSKNEDSDTNTGMEHLTTKLLSLLYPRDHRMAEVFSLLQSSIPVTIDLTQRPEVSDHDFIEEQEKHLGAISTRTMALPVARGMLTLRTLPCAPTEPLALPRLCVSGRAPPPRAAAVTLGGADTSPHCLLWPAFHNGVAAGLALVPMTGAHIDSSWVIFNKPKGTQEMSTEHAGFLMALGLNGHLRDMPFMNIYEYLVRCNEMISVGLLLGIAATYRGTMDLQATKMMSIHLEALLPPSHVELDIQHGILVSALLGLGLVYQGTRHAHLAQVLLLEIGKPPGPEPESCAEREGYALAAGLALGLVMAGAGGAAPHHALALRTYMLGGERGARPPPGGQRDKYKQGSCGVRAGSNANLDVTSPGATLALGLMYLRSGDAAVASWLAPPDTAYLLDYVRPDLLMLRIIARGLIMWDSIEASEEWIENQVPSTIRPYCFVKPTDENIDYEAMNQAYCNIIAGACFALGLRFAGSGDHDARDAALHYTQLLLAVRGKSVAELAGRSTLDASLCVCLLAAGMVSPHYTQLLLAVRGKSVACMIMAGRGDVAVLRCCRRLRARAPPPPAPPALTHGGQICDANMQITSIDASFGGATHDSFIWNYYPIKTFLEGLNEATWLLNIGELDCKARASQMAVHCTVGLLFLGGGRATLSTAATAVAALVAAFFPKFPTHSEDNRYHLQAFRHLYVLATEPRLILPRDLSTGKLCYAHLQVIDLSGAVREMRAPGIIPALDELREVRVDDPRYWPITFQRDRNWDQLKTFLEYSWCIDIKQRAGCLSYADDPQGFLTILAQSLTLDQANIWSVTPENIELFTNDDRVKNFVKHYLSKETSGTICADCLLITKKKKGLKNEGFLPKQCVCRAYSGEEREYAQSLSMVTYECVVKDILCALPIWTTFLKIIKTMKTNPSPYHIWQVKLLLSQTAAHARRAGRDLPVAGQEHREPLMASEFTLSITQRVASIFDGWEPKIAPYLRKYLGLTSSRKISSTDDEMKKILSSFLIYHDLPRNVLKGVSCDNELELLLAPAGAGLGASGARAARALLR